MPENKQEQALIACVGMRLKQLRADAGLTQEEMALRMECGLRNYQRMEAGKANLSLRTLARLAVVLKVAPAALLPATPFGARRDTGTAAPAGVPA